MAHGDPRPRLRSPEARPPSGASILRVAEAQSPIGVDGQVQSGRRQGEVHCRSPAADRFTDRGCLPTNAGFPVPGLVISLSEDGFGRRRVDSGRGAGRRIGPGGRLFGGHAQKFDQRRDDGGAGPRLPARPQCCEPAEPAGRGSRRAGRALDSWDHRCIRPCGDCCALRSRGRLAPDDAGRPASPRGVAPGPERRAFGGPLQAATASREIEGKSFGSAQQEAARGSLGLDHRRSRRFHPVGRSRPVHHPRAGDQRFAARCHRGRYRVRPRQPDRFRFSADALSPAGRHGQRYRKG